MTVNYVDIAVQSLTTYYYAVKAVDDNANLSAEDVVVAFTPSNGQMLGTYVDGADSPTFMSIESPWQLSAELPSAGALNFKNAPQGSNYPNQTCAAITTPPIQLQAGSPQLSYQAKYDLEADWDGVVVEISTDGGGSWNDLAPDQGYPGNFSQTMDPPINECGYIASHGAFNGTSGGAYAGFSNDLSAFAGQSIQLRWRFSSDPGAEENGFLLDEVNLTLASTPGQCTLAEEVFADGFEN